MPIPTIEDVANAAGVSKSTVSRVLNGEYTYIRDNTRIKVQKAIADLGFRPNSVARSLTSKRTQTIGVLVSDVSNPFYSDVVHGVEDIAIDQSYNVFLGNINYDQQRGMALIRSLIDRRVDGILIMSSTTSDEWLDELDRNNIPVVVLDWDIPITKGTISAISVDFEIGIHQAVEHLLSLGHHKFAHVSGPQRLQTSRDRMNAFLGSLAKHGIPAEEVTVIESNFRIDGGREAGIQIMEMANRPTAVFAGNDLLAHGILSAAHMQGLSVPGDLSVIGLDDIWLAAETDPPLTTVALPRYEIGALAVRTMLELLNRPKAEESEPIRSTVKTNLIIRKSTAPPKM
jgi:LacI family transcriptional regulator